MNAKRVIPLLMLFMVGAAFLHAQFVNGRFVTSFYTFQRFDTVGSSHTYLRAFQTVQLSAAQGDVSVNTFLQGAMNGTNEFGDLGRVRFYNLFLRWANIGAIGEMSLGRQAVYAGVGNGTIDGLSARARIWNNRITVAGYGGSTVNEDFTGVRTNWHDNLNVGGQVCVTPLSGARIGVSYMNRRQEADPYWTTRARDTTYIPVPYPIANEATSEQLGSVDASYSCDGTVSAYGRYDYDFNFSTTARGQGSLRVNFTDALALTGDYIYRKPRISFNSIFAAFTSSSTSEVEGGLEYGFSPLLRAFGRVGVVSYVDTSSVRWTVGLSTGYGNVSYSGSNGYAGELESFTVQGAYPVFDHLLVPSIGLTLAQYRLSAGMPKDNALEVLLGATVRAVRNLTFDLQGQWMRNQLYARDMRLQVRLMYWFAERMSLLSSEEVK